MYDWLRVPAAGVCTWRGRTFGRWTRHVDRVCDSYADWKDAEDCPVLVLTANREYIGRAQFFSRYQSVERLVETMLQMIGTNQPCAIETGMFYAVYSPLGRVYAL